jgi:aminopeptidase N
MYIKLFLMRKILWLFLLFSFFPVFSASDGYPRNVNADVLHYQFALTINDSTDTVEGSAVIIVKFLHAADSMSFDLKGINSAGKGMYVTQILLNTENVKWNHGEEKLVIYFKNTAEQGDTLTFVIGYRGIPSDGLIISKNKFGNRTFFADNWPDRAHCYLPCIDHPYDKASVEFIITAPDRYKVVANGSLIEESDLIGEMSLTHWSESVPIATKVMTFGAAMFAVKLSGIVNNIPVWSWVFPENRSEGFSDYSVASRPLEYYSNVIGPYPYEKLANVQSKTIYGGLENAGTIFYSERSVTGKGLAEGLIAHEIAHQWFGNCVTEGDWLHVWLSEGFATYMTSLYFESLQGRTRLESDMITARTRVLKYYEKIAKPVIDTTIVNLMNLLNANSYQKGAWVLHMLRHELGDEDFMKGLQLYYLRFKNANALTEDFKGIMEQVSGKDLGKFFQQWLYMPGQPELMFRYENNRKKGITEIFIEQKQEHLFEFNIELLIKGDSTDRIVNAKVNGRVTKISVPFTRHIVIIPDPRTNLLFK